MDSNSKLKLAVATMAVLLCLATGIIIGFFVGSAHHGEKSSSETVLEATEDVAAPVEKQKEEEKIYGYYPSFYMKNIYFTVSGNEGDHRIKYYLDSETRIAKAYTDCRWLEEADLEDGGSFFHVKKNKDDETRKGKLFLIDNKGRKITIYVTQRAL